MEHKGPSLRNPLVLLRRDFKQAKCALVDIKLPDSSVYILKLLKHSHTHTHVHAVKIVRASSSPAPSPYHFMKRKNAMKAENYSDEMEPLLFL